MKLNLGKTLIISLAFFTISLAWTIYNNYVPDFLKGVIKSSTVVGIIMTIDNIFGIIFQPYFARLSDTTSNRFGRRMPFLLVGIPLSAVFFMLIPWYDRLSGLFPGAQLAIPFIMIFVILMNFSMSVYRAPAIALMPDATPPELRSRANGIINAIGGLGSIIAFIVGGYLANLNKVFPFVLGSVLMLLALVVLILFYREPKVPYSADPEKVKGEDTGLFFGKNGTKPIMLQNPSLINMLLTVFFWFCGFECLNSFFVIYCKESFGLSAGDATQMMAPMALIFMLCAYPGGILGSRIGRKKAMLLGNAIVVVSFLSLYLMKGNILVTALLSVQGIHISLMSVIMAIGGVGWAFMNANAYPAIAEMAPAGQTGRYTGYYYAFTFAASIASPILFGVVADLFQTHSMLFLFGGLMFAAGVVFLALAKKSSISAEG